MAIASLDMNKRSQPAVPKRLEQKRQAPLVRNCFLFRFLKKFRKPIINIFVALLFIFAVIWGYGHLTADSKDKSFQGNAGWYSVKLTDGEIYFGQIDNISADPIVIKNVYYDYDRTAGEDEDKKASTTGNLRLVKRGNETYGPSGEMNVVRSQVLFMEPLKSDSKVLQAILEYEKNK